MTEQAGTLEINILKDMIQGLETRRDDLIKARDMFLKAQGLDEQIEKARAEITEIETEMKKLKEKLAGFKDQKTEAIRSTMFDITTAMNKVIADGDGCIQIDDDGVLIGWFKDNVFRPYDGLSGGEKVIFESALCYALLGDVQNKMIVLEGGELDDENLFKMLGHLNKIDDAQLVVNTCHGTDLHKKGWEQIKL